jgi:colanic acid/amylovoran biosynthesis protein
MTNILLVNVHSLGNAGDAALLSTTIQQLRQNFLDCHITIAMDELETSLADVKVVESISAWVKLPSIVGWKSWRLLNLFFLPFTTLLAFLTYRLFGKPLYILTPPILRPAIQTYFDTDLVVSIPGGYLYSSGIGLVFVITLYSIVLAWLAGKPFYIYPQSFGPLTRKWEGRLLRWSLNKARIVMVRESISLELLKKINLNHPRLYLLPDIAFAYKDTACPAAGNWLRDHGIEPKGKRPLLGLTVINFGAQNRNFKRQGEYEDACAEAIRYFVNQYNGRAILFPQVIGPSDDCDDRIPARRIIAKLPDVSDSVLLLEQILSPSFLKTLYGKMDVFIGTRMHSNIFALSESVPVIAIGYMHKTQGIAAMVKMDQWVLDIQKINSKVLISKLIDLCHQRESLKAHIANTFPSLVEQANRAGQLCAEDFAQIKKVNGLG